MLSLVLFIPDTCFICGDPAWNTCADCTGVFKGGDEVHFCDECDGRVHKRKSRVNHKREQCTELLQAGELELLSVLCIETSHYVCFTRDSEGRWLFFDSMANRLCESLGS